MPTQAKVFIELVNSQIPGPKIFFNKLLEELNANIHLSINQKHEKDKISQMENFIA